MTLTIKVNYNHQPAPADERTVEMMIHYTDMVTTFTDSASPDRLREKNVPFSFYFTGSNGFRVFVRDTALFRFVDETKQYARTHTHL